MKISHLDEIEPQPLAHDAAILKRILLSESQLPSNVRLSQATFAPGERITAHCHPELSEVFYVLSGNAELIVDGQSQLIRQGHAFCIDPGEMHQIINGTSSPLSLLYFGLVPNAIG